MWANVGHSVAVSVLKPSMPTQGTKGFLIWGFYNVGQCGPFCCSKCLKAFNGAEHRLTVSLLIGFALQMVRSWTCPPSIPGSRLWKRFSLLGTRTESRSLCNGCQMSSKPKPIWKLLVAFIWPARASHVWVACSFALTRATPRFLTGRQMSKWQRMWRFGWSFLAKSLGRTTHSFLNTN